ncbi:hypothetical protein [Gilliamella sp. ESL0405]|uniref:hypothetical protein n=1 Tax=Gilliamella sp. ESL0405 TaxID=2704653 RepID=UPI001C694A83|nr:hypothetical protein [Gilliamella sp. ESL0405]QYN47564.1 hypothetical protein GYM74_10310 [Gilliamella sp. ESL0405]
MATSSFSKNFVLAEPRDLNVFFELEKAQSTIKTRERDEKTESKKAIKLFSKVLTKKNAHG